MKYELKYLSLGEMIGRAFNIYINNLLPLLLISVVSNIPYLIFRLYTMNFPVANLTQLSVEDATFALFDVVGTIFISIIVTALCTGLMIEIISKKYLGKTVTFKKYYKNTLSRIVPLIIMALLAGLIIMLGYIVFVIPGIILMLGFALSGQVFIIEKKGIKDSLKRSWQLSKGKKSYIFWIMIIFSIVIMGIYYAVTFLLNTIFFPVSVNLEQVSAAKIIVTHIISAVLEPFSTCGIILLYFNLRIQKEGFEIEHLAKRFASDDNTEEG